MKIPETMRAVAIDRYGGPSVLSMHELPVPPHYETLGFEDGFSQSVGVAYSRIASDMRNRTTLSPTFEDAVNLHRVLDAIVSGIGERRDV